MLTWGDLRCLIPQNTCCSRGASGYCSRTNGFAKAADLPVKAAKKPADLPFFLVIDDRVTFSYIFQAKQPGMWSANPNGTVNSNTTKQVYSFTHFDLYKYGTNFFTISLFKSDHNDPANPCFNAGPRGESVRRHRSCQLRGRQRNLRPVPLDRRLEPTLRHQDVLDRAVGKHFVRVRHGCQHREPLLRRRQARRRRRSAIRVQPAYKGYFNVAPLVYWEFWNHNGFAQCGSGFSGPTPGVTCLADGNTSFKPTWAVETNYYMDLGFLPPSHAGLLDQRPRRMVRQKGTDTEPLPFNPANGVFNTAVEFISEPIRLTLDASKAIWGDKWSHFVDVWVAYRYWQNKFGLDHAKASPAPAASRPARTTARARSPQATPASR